MFFPYADKVKYYNNKNGYYDNYEGGLFVIKSNGEIVEMKSQYMANTNYIKNSAEEYHMKPLNFRLRPLKNIKKWKTSINKHLKKS